MLLYIHAWSRIRLTSRSMISFRNPQQLRDPIRLPSARATSMALAHCHFGGSASLHGIKARVCLLLQVIPVPPFPSLLHFLLHIPSTRTLLRCAICDGMFYWCCPDLY